MKQVGMHLRHTGSMLEVIERARRLELPFFQCFFVLQATGKLITPTDEEVAAFVRMREQYFNDLYVHGSYWINLAGVRNVGYRALQRELALARRFGFTHIILHPGSARGARDRRDGIAQLARLLDRALKDEQEIVLVLENTTHAGFTVGSDMQDFKEVLALMDRPERIKFCIDTAHAHSFGYRMIEPADQNAFIDLIDETVGTENVVLLHVNDAKHECGSRIDAHEMPGQGVMGEAVLRRFVSHEKLVHIPLLLEPPVMTEEEECAMLDAVRAW